MKISVAMIVKNEEVLLARCLDTVKDADEIIICDTGSEDSTVEIAKKYTDKVYTDFVWCDHFGKARQHSKDKCTGDWILTIDADDVLDCSFDELRAEIESADKQGCEAMNIFTVARGTGISNVFPRAYKNIPEIKWYGAAHNYLKKDGGEIKTYNSNITTIYDSSPSHKKDPNRTLRILTKAVMEDRKLTREKFYLAREHFYKRNWADAIFWYREYLENPGWKGEEAQAYYMLGRCYYYKQRTQEAYNSLLRAIQINPNFKDAIFFLAQISQPTECMRWMEFAEGADNSGVLFSTFPAKEKDSDYYDEHFLKDNDMSRYKEIMEFIGDIVKGKSVLDIGCGLAELSKYVDDYSGFDFSEYAISKAKDSSKDLNVWVGDAYKVENYKKADLYVCTEVLEHVKRDIDIIRNIPSGSEYIVTVPSFADPSHIRLFNKEYFNKRYGDYLDIKLTTRFNWDSKNRKWTLGGEPTGQYIYLFGGTRK